MNCETAGSEATCGQRDVRRLLREQPQHRGERLRLLRGEFPLRPRRERRRPEPEEPVALGCEPLGQPPGRVLHAAVLLEAPRELLRGLLGLELGEVGVLREQAARLQLEQRSDQHEELTADLEVELFALGEPLDEGDDDPRHVHLGQVELLPEHEGQQEVERPFEGVQVQLELAHDHGRHPSAVPG